MNWSVNAATTNPDECIKFVNWVVNSEECNKVLGSERGVSINPQIREMLSQNATPILQDVFNFVDKVSKLQTVAYKSQAPVGTNEVSTLITDSLAEMFYGMATPEETAKKIVEEANKILANNN